MCHYIENYYTSDKCKRTVAAPSPNRGLGGYLDPFTPPRGDGNAAAILEPHKICFRTYYQCPNPKPGENSELQGACEDAWRNELVPGQVDRQAQVSRSTLECPVCKAIEEAEKKASIEVTGMNSRGEVIDIRKPKAGRTPRLPPVKEGKKKRLRS